ncbi:hypothetical protein SUGI_0605140 [Cryptomeria japonica]|nr:hypothetical protein SUGI_0605140 [Cryptomeria japonica]
MPEGSNVEVSSFVLWNDRADREARTEKQRIGWENLKDYIREKEVEMRMASVKKQKDVSKKVLNLIERITNFEARLVKTVVNDLIKTLDRVSLPVAKHPVGLDTIKNLLINKLNLNSMDEVVKVGIWGIGGIGKTTVAKAVYNQIYTDFEAASFVSDVRTTAAAEAKGLKRLQNQILKDLIKIDEKVNSVDQGMSLFRDRLGGMRVLLILDDVDAVDQLNALVGDWLAPGSRVIITSRDRRILIAAPMPSECIHEMSGLEINESLQLFSWHAFLRASPTPNYEYLSKRIVEACKGHPLSLEVIGSFLYAHQDDTGCWTETLQNITINPEIHRKLYISYSSLSDDEKEIFVDIACFFIGEQKRLPILFWKSLYNMVDIAVSNLSMKSLIKIDDEGVFDMHDHFRDLGQTIAEKEREGTRLWKAAHLSTLSNNINLSRLQLKGGNLHRLERLYRPGLRYLHLQKVHIEGMTEDTGAMLPPSLIWLRLENCTFATGKNKAINKLLAAIRKKYRAQRKKGHSRFVGNMKQLKIMQINGSNIHSKSCLFSLLNLEQMQYLDLGRCILLNNLPDTIGSLSKLQYLNLRGCRRLNSLPDTIGNLSQLQHLDLRWCESLNNLPDTIGNMSQLQSLDLRGCKRLNNLPDTIGNLSQLQFLDMEWCESLNNLPNTIGNLAQLQHLKLIRHEKVNKLLDIGNLSQLQCLGLRESGVFNNLPDTIGNLAHLQLLYLGGCEMLNNLPDTIGNLSRLQHLYLRECGRLNNLPDAIGNLSQLQLLHLEECKRLNNLPNTIGNLSQLQFLYLRGCGSLNNLPNAIGNLSQLQHLDLSECGSLNRLPDTIGNLSQLQHLDLRACGRLNSLSATIGNLSQLQRLDLGGCESLNELPDTIGNLSQLQHLDLTECGRLINLPDSIGKLSQLQHLDLRECGSLNSLPDTIGNLSQLQHLDLTQCDRLNNLPNTIGNLSRLQNLYLTQCERLNNLPANIGNLSQLQHLDLGGCERLNNLPDTIGNLSQLQYLDLRACWNLNNLPHTIANLSATNVFRF